MIIETLREQLGPIIIELRRALARPAPTLPALAVPATTLILIPPSPSLPASQSDDEIDPCPVVDNPLEPLPAHEPPPQPDVPVLTIQARPPPIASCRLLHVQKTPSVLLRAPGAPTIYISWEGTPILGGAGFAVPFRDTG
jgi:hypothetical protein